MLSSGISFKKMDIYGEEYQKCQVIADGIKNSEIGEHYSSMMCLRDVGGVAPANVSTLKRHYDKIEPYISNSFQDVVSHQEKRKCVLPKDHPGPCSCTLELFNKNPTTDKIKSKVKLSIHSTPGADDYVIKDRDNRLHPVAITREQERLIRDKKKKLACAIPLKEKTTPFLMSSAYLDYLTYILSISDINEHIDQESPHYKLCIDMLNKHKQYLTEYYGRYNRKVFNSDGHTICAVLGTTLKVENLADPERDNRTDPRPSDIQMGHISSRCDDCYTIYGTNIVMMTRRGNLIIGEHSFIEDTWKLEHKSISIHHNITHINEKQLSILKEKGLSDSDIQLFLSS